MKSITEYTIKRIGKKFEKVFSHVESDDQPADFPQWFDILKLCKTVSEHCIIEFKKCDKFRELKKQYRQSRKQKTRKYR